MSPEPGVGLWGSQAELGECHHFSLREGREGSQGWGGCRSLPRAAGQGWCTAPLFLPSPLHDASCPGTVTVGSQLCPVCSAAKKCSWFCSYLLLVFALVRQRATSSPSVPVSFLGWAVPLLPWLALPAPKPSAGSLLGGTGLAPPRTNLALPSRQRWQSPACPQLCWSWTPGLPTLGQVQAPLHPSEAAGDCHE